MAWRNLPSVRWCSCLRCSGGLPAGASVLAMSISAEASDDGQGFAGVTGSMSTVAIACRGHGRHSREGPETARQHRPVAALSADAICCGMCLPVAWPLSRYSTGAADPSPVLRRGPRPPRHRGRRLPQRACRTVRPRSLPPGQGDRHRPAQPRRPGGDGQPRSGEPPAAGPVRCRARGSRHDSARQRVLQHSPAARRQLGCPRR
jgi:hypothetical protein